MQLKLLACVLVGLAVAGCGRSTLEATVSGVVTLDGKAVGPGVVSFVNAEEQRNPATGTIQTDGSYHLFTNRTEGVRPGKYRATVAVYDQPPVKPGERSMVPAKLITPVEYADVSRSNLLYEVVPGQNSIVLELKSKP